jgi:hypothetical protein
MNSIGQKGEHIVREYMRRVGYNVTPAPDCKFYDYDMECHNWEASFTIEVKTDVSAYKHAKRRGKPDNVRLFIEYWNDTMDEPSGIAASVAEYYFYLIVNPDNDVECNVFKRDELHQYLIDSDTFTHTLVPFHNDHQTTGWLPNLDDLVANNIVKRQFVIDKW